MIRNNTETHDLLVSVISSSPYGIIAIDINGTIVMCNKLVVQHLNLASKPKSLVEKELAPYLLNLPRLTKKIRNCLEKGRKAFDLNNVKLFDGRILNIKGRKIINGMIITTADITETKQLERKVLNAMILGQENERQRLAKEIHDGIGPLMSTIKMNLESVKSELTNIQPKTMQKIANLEELVQNVAIDVRSISHALMPSAIKDFGLVSTVDNLAVKVNSSETISVQFFHNGMEGRFNPEIEMGFYRIIQELLNNAFKYANAETITIQLIKYPEHITLTVEDDGNGFDINQIDSSRNGIGLNNIKARVIALNGFLNIDSSPGRGVTTTIEVPIKTSKQ